MVLTAAVVLLLASSLVTTTVRIVQARDRVADAAAADAAAPDPLAPTAGPHPAYTPPPAYHGELAAASPSGAPTADVPDPAPFASRFVETWLSGRHNPPTWAADIRHLANAELAATLIAADRRTIPDGRVSGLPTIDYVRDGTASVRVPTSAGAFRVEAELTGDTWQAASIGPA